MTSKLPLLGLALLWLAVALLIAPVASAHGIAMEQLILRPDFAGGQLRGQVTFDPHRVRKDNAAGEEAITRDVLKALGASIVVEIDGKKCPLEFEVRELWAPQGATVGDIVGLHCPLAAGARELRVFAAASMKTLAVSVEEPGVAGGSASRSVLIQGNSFTPTYHFGAAAREWQEGGADQFLSAPAASASAAPVASSVPASAPSGGFEDTSQGSLAVRYLVLGFHHILPLGWDHVLFVLGLVLGSGRSWRRLVLQLSAFTLAHTLTLGLGALGWVVLPARVVEPLIAVSIAYVAVENLWGPSAPRWRLLVVLAFGLLHGQGFASALADVGLPREAFLLSLLSFNLGVELGQLVVVALAAFVLNFFRDEANLQRYVVRPASVAIALVGVFWAIQRLLA